MKEDYLVMCGKWFTTESVDREIFETHKEACFEAATKSLEKYFKMPLFLTDYTGCAAPENSLCLAEWPLNSTTCIVRPAETPNSNKNDYLIFPPKLYENIGLHIVSEYFNKINHG